MFSIRNTAASYFSGFLSFLKCSKTFSNSALFAFAESNAVSSLELQEKMNIVVIIYNNNCFMIL